MRTSFPPQTGTPSDATKSPAREGFQDKETKSSPERRNARADETDERENRLTITLDTAEKIAEGNEI